MFSGTSLEQGDQMGRKEIILIAALFLFSLLPGCKENEDITGTDTATVEEDLINNVLGHEDAEDYIWDDSQATTINLQDNASTTSASSVSISGNIVTITSAGYYSISGTLSSGQLIVNTTDEGTVKLLFNGVNITYTSSSPFFVANAAKNSD